MLITMESQPNYFEVDLAVVIRVALNVVFDSVFFFFFFNPPTTTLFLISNLTFVNFQIESKMLSLAPCT